MAEDKKISPRNAAIAVLKKFEELLVKAEKEHKHIGWNKLHSKLEDEGYSKESADKIAGSIKAKVHPAKKSESLKKEDATPPAASSPSQAGGQTINSQIGYPFGKSDENPDEKQDAALGEKVEQDVEQHMIDNKEAEQKEGHPIMQDHVKGHIKLAKFMGHIEGKKSAKIMPDSGNDEPTTKIDQVGPSSSSPKKLI